MNEFIQNTEEAEQWLLKYGVENYTLVLDAQDGLLVNVSSYVDLSWKNLDSIAVNFGDIDGTFECGNNQLTSLKGSPKRVAGDFICESNLLTNLESCPSSVGGGFYCARNELVSIKGPSIIGADFDCRQNKIAQIFDFSLQSLGGFVCLKGNALLKDLQNLRTWENMVIFTQRHQLNSQIKSSSPTQRILKI